MNFVSVFCLTVLLRTLKKTDQSWYFLCNISALLTKLVSSLFFPLVGILESSQPICSPLTQDSIFQSALLTFPMVAAVTTGHKTVDNPTYGIHLFNKE